MSSQTIKRISKMETVIKLQIEQDDKDFELEIDNSTDFKDFVLTVNSNQVDDKKRTLNIQINDREKIIEINGIKFSGLMLQILKEFINQ